MSTMPKSNTKVIVLVAAVTFTAFLLLALPAIASDEQNPVGSRTAALTVQGGENDIYMYMYMYSSIRVYLNFTCIYTT